MSLKSSLVLGIFQQFATVVGSSDHLAEKNWLSGAKVTKSHEQVMQKLWECTFLVCSGCKENGELLFNFLLSTYVEWVRLSAARKVLQRS